jgi:hypothetical protein
MFDWLKAIPPAARDFLDTWRHEREVMHTRRHAPQHRRSVIINGRIIDRKDGAS